MRTKSTWILVAIVVLLSISAIGLYGISAFLNADETQRTIAENEQEKNGISNDIQFADKGDIDSVSIRDNNALYEDDDPFDVVTMYLTVCEGNASDGTNHTWAEVNSHSAYYYEELAIDRYKVAGLLQVGDENGPVIGQLGYGETLPNATVQIRGQTSTRYEQKNYKIKLVDNSDGWRGQRTIALNKHMQDGLRFRNKLAYDLMTEIPQIVGLRTQFVHLYVKDKTGDNPDQFVDYGLYTQVEQLNKTAMRAHSLDRNGQLYKINYFEFQTYDDIIKTVDDPDYDKRAFEELLEIKGNSDHSKLIAMLQDVNDYTLSSDEVLDKWFDRENLSYWMAFMLLVGNTDTQSRNVYIYSPLNSNKWYFIPWDNDSMLMHTENQLISYNDFDNWERGIGNYWGNTLFKRAILSENYRNSLKDAMDDLIHGALSPEHVKELCDKYKEVVRPYVFSMPDIYYERLTEEQFDDVCENLQYDIWDNYETVLESFNAPLPFYVGEPEITGDSLYLHWETAFTLNVQKVRYHVILARDYERKDIVFEENDIRIPELTREIHLPAGQYFLHVDAENDDGFVRDCFDYYINTDGKVYGTYCFWVMEDGSIEVFEDDE